jgi:acyl-CoA synthetase (AMP-forming)/AMP-acid ligase II
VSQLLRSFAADFDALVSNAGERPAICGANYETWYTYGEVGSLVSRAQALFADRGLQPGDCLLSLLPNTMGGIVAFLAAARGGFSYAPLSADAVAQEVGRAIELIRPRLCLVSENASDAVREILRLAGVAVIAITQDESLSWLPPAGASPQAGVAGRIFLSTSGTTGEPKAIVLGVDRLWSSAKAFTGLHRFLGESSRFLNILPISYLGGLFNLCLIPMACGGSFVVDEAFSGKSLLGFWQRIAQFDINVLWLVPSIVRGLLAIADRTARQQPLNRNVRACFLGTAPIELATKKRFENVFGIPLLENFALSETTFLTSEMLDDGRQREEGSVGGLLPYVMLRLYPVSGDGAADDTSAQMEVAVRTPFLFQGYLQADGSLDLPLDGDGFFRTGDLGHLTADGQIVIDGRLRDFIKKGGFFVALREIEILAQSYEDVAEAVAAPVRHEFYGESYRLFVVFKDGERSPEALTLLGAWLRQHLVRHKWPERIEAVDSFPRTASGKVRKKLLVAESQ